MKRITGLLLILQLFVVSFSFAQQGNSTVKISDEKMIIDGQKFYLHKVSPGQTLYSISKAYHVESKILMVHNPELAEGLKAGSTIRIPVVEMPEPETAQVTDTSKFHMIEIRRKHTLYSLSKQYNVTIQEIYDANPGLEQRGLKRKDVIKIPKHSLTVNKIDFTDPVLQRDSSKYIYHTVKAGETLYSLSRKYKLSKDVISEQNPDIEERHLRVGEVIKIPKQEVQFVISFPAENDSITMNMRPDSIADSLAVADVFMPDSLSMDQTDEIHIVLMLPFGAQKSLAKAETLSRQNKDPLFYPMSNMMLQFYQGFLMGISDLDLEGKTLDIEVYDSGASVDAVSNALSNLKKVPDLFIGPMSHDNTQLVLDYGMKHHVPVLAPVEETDTALLAYPNLISINSNERVHNEFIASWLYQRDDNIVIVHDGEAESLRIAQQVKNDFDDFFAAKDVSSEYTVKLFHYDTKNHSALKGQMSEQDTNVVIAITHNPVHVTSLINKLYQFNKHEIRLIGESAWINMNGIAPEELRRLKMAYVSPMFVNYQDTASFQFIENYRDTFLDEPDKYAFMGYDVAQLLIPQVYFYGENFAFKLANSKTFCGLSMNWNFIRNHSSQPLLNTSLKLIELKESYKLQTVYEKNIAKDFE